MSDDLALRKTGRKPSCTCGICKKCTWAAYMREYYHSKTPEERRRLFVAGRDPVRVAAHEKKRANTEERRASLRRSQLRYPEKHKARQAVYRAVKRGEIQRGPCEACGLPRVEAHHDDYSRPLEVKWLCRAHHKVLHQR